MSHHPGTQHAPVRGRSLPLSMHFILTDYGDYSPMALNQRALQKKRAKKAEQRKAKTQNCGAGAGGGYPGA